MFSWTTEGFLTGTSAHRDHREALEFVGYRPCQPLTAKPQQHTDPAEEGEEEGKSQLQRLGGCVGSSPGTARTELLTAT